MKEENIVLNNYEAYKKENDKILLEPYQALVFEEAPAVKRRILKHIRRI